LWSRTMKQASVSSIDQRGGKGRGIKQLPKSPITIERPADNNRADKC